MAERFSRREFIIGTTIGLVCGAAVGRLTVTSQVTEHAGLQYGGGENKKEIQSNNLLTISIGNIIKHFLTAPLLYEQESGAIQVFTPVLSPDVSASYRLSRDRIEGPLDFRFACFDSNKCKYQKIGGTYIGVAELPREAYKPVGSIDVEGFFGVTTLFILRENGVITEDKYLINPRAVTMFNARIHKGKHVPELENSAEYYDITLNKPWKIVGDTAVELAGDLQVRVLFKDNAQVGEPVALLEEVYPISILK